MTTKNATRERKVICKGIRNNQTEFGEVLDFRLTPKSNIVLIFEGAEVIMPSAWRCSQDLCVGDVVKAYWDEGNGFHLEWAQ